MTHRRQPQKTSIQNLPVLPLVIRAERVTVQVHPTGNIRVIWQQGSKQTWKNTTLFTNATPEQKQKEEKGRYG